VIARAWGVKLLAFLLLLGLVSRRRALDDVFRWLLLLLTHYQVLVLLSAFPTGHTSTLGFVVGAVRGFAVPSPGYLVSCNSATETLVDAIALIAVTLLVGGLVAWRLRTLATQLTALTLPSSLSGRSGLSLLDWPVDLTIPPSSLSGLCRWRFRSTRGTASGGARTGANASRK